LARWPEKFDWSISIYGSTRLIQLTQKSRVANWIFVSFKILTMNKTPEQKARDNTDKMLEKSGWKVVDKNAIDWNLGLGLAVREYQTDVGPADYVLFLDRKPVGVIEAKKEEDGHRLNVHEGQAEYYAQGRLKWFADNHQKHEGAGRTGVYGIYAQR
jgi:hypothetical protein